MNREDAIRMAQTLPGCKTHWYGTLPDGSNRFDGATFTPEAFERFVTLVTAAERGRSKVMNQEELTAEIERLLKEIEVLKSDVAFWRRQYDDAKRWYQSVTGKGAWG